MTADIPRTAASGLGRMDSCCFKYADQACQYTFLVVRRHEKLSRASDPIGVNNIWISLQTKTSTNVITQSPTTTRKTRLSLTSFLRFDVDEYETHRVQHLILPQLQ